MDFEELTSSDWAEFSLPGKPKSTLGNVNGPWVPLTGKELQEMVDQMASISKPSKILFTSKGGQHHYKKKVWIKDLIGIGDPNFDKEQIEIEADYPLLMGQTGYILIKEPPANSAVYDVKNEICDLRICFKFSDLNGNIFIPDGPKNSLDTQYPFQLSFKKFDDWAMCMKHIGKKPNENIVAQTFSMLQREFDTCKSEKDLNFYYKTAHSGFIKGKDDLTLIIHLQRLLLWDQRGDYLVDRFWKDSSESLVRILYALDDSNFVFNYFAERPKRLKEIYEAIQGEKNEKLFFSFLSGLCTACIHKEEYQDAPVFKIGGSYTLESDILFEESENLIFLANYGKERTTIELNWTPQSGLEAYSRTVTADVNVVPIEMYFHPMELVGLQVEGSDKIEYVPALFIQYLANNEEWRKVIVGLLVAVNVIAITLSLTTGGASLLAIVVTGLNVIIATIDTGVLLSDDDSEDAVWFKENWNKLMQVLAVGSLSALAYRIVRHGPTMLLRLQGKTGVQVARLRAAIKTVTVQAFREFEIPNFKTGSISVFSNYKELKKYMQSASIAEREYDALFSEGVIFAKAVRNTQKADEAIVLLYNAEVIAEGTSKEVRNSLKPYKGLSKAKLIEALIRRSKRTKIFVANAKDIGKQANKVHFNIIDEFGNAIGELLRTVGAQGRELKYNLIQKGEKTALDSYTTLLNQQLGKEFSLPVSHGETILFADFNVPKRITDEFSGFGGIMLDDALAFYNMNKKFTKVDGTIGHWLKSETLYSNYGGESINLTQFWNAVNFKKMTYEQAAFETFSGRWAKQNGFTKVEYKLMGVRPNKVTIKFID